MQVFNIRIGILLCSGILQLVMICLTIPNTLPISHYLEEIDLQECVICHGKKALITQKLNCLFWIPKIAGVVRFASSYYVEDASFLKLKNVVLGYSLPKNGCKKQQSLIFAYMFGRKFINYFWL